MENEIMITGVGGQGVQLGAQVLARAATIEDRQVMYLGTYGGTMRGGNTDSTVVVADGRIGAPPIVARGWSAIVMHPRYFEPMRAKLSPGVVVYDAGLTGDALDTGGARGFGVDGAAIATAAEAGRAASLVLLGAYCGLTGMVGLEALNEALAEAVPPYRHDRLDANRRALAAGYEALPASSAPAWEDAA